jgi:cobalt-zinc-cadmium efflux system outer membrane protein
MRLSLAAAVTAACALVASVNTDASALTLEDALQAARATGPAAIVAEARMEEARTKLASASRIVVLNPEVDLDAGSRSGDGDGSAELEAHVIQPLEVGGRRGARVAAAEADAELTAAESAGVVNAYLVEVAAGFLKARHAAERERLAASGHDLAGRTLAAAERQYESGDVAVLDVNLARAEVGRAEAALAQARAASLEQRGALAAALGLEPGAPLELEGPIVAPELPDRAALVERALRRPDVRKLRAELATAHAQYETGAAKRWPDLGVGVGYAREADEEFVTGGVRIVLPLFDHGQAERAEAVARAQRINAELAAAARRARAEVASAYESYVAKRRAAAELERTTLALLERNEDLAQRSYAAGESSLADLLLVRRQAFETRTEHADLLLEAALAGVAVLGASGALS